MMLVALFLSGIYRRSRRKIRNNNDGRTWILVFHHFFFRGLAPPFHIPRERERSVHGFAKSANSHPKFTHSVNNLNHKTFFRVAIERKSYPQRTDTSSFPQTKTSLLSSSFTLPFLIVGRCYDFCANKEGRRIVNVVENLSWTRSLS